MKKLSWAILIYSFIFIIVFWGFNVLDTISHEKVHKQIFEYYGINSTIKVDYLNAYGVTSPISNSTRCNDSCRYLHSWNEIISYNLSTATNCILLVVYAIGLIYIFIRYMEDELNNYEEEEIDDLSLEGGI